MLGDELGMGGQAVHAEAEAVLRFWLEETPAGKRFARDDALDRAIADRFAALRERVIADPLPWQEDGRTLLAAVVLIDQFGRNLFRGRADAFAHDPLALSLSSHAIGLGWDAGMGPEEKQFLYMPFMHSEVLADQRRGVALFEASGNEQAADYARRHLSQIERFGRFPGRNAALGRETTAAEEKALEDPAERF